MYLAPGEPIAGWEGHGKERKERKGGGRGNETGEKEGEKRSQKTTFQHLQTPHTCEQKTACVCKPKKEGRGGHLAGSAVGSVPCLYLEGQGAHPLALL